MDDDDKDDTDSHNDTDTGDIYNRQAEYRDKEYVDGINRTKDGSFLRRSPGGGRQLDRSGSPRPTPSAVGASC